MILLKPSEYAEYNRFSESVFRSQSLCEFTCWVSPTLNHLPERSRPWGTHLPPSSPGPRVHRATETACCPHHQSTNVSEHVSQPVPVSQQLKLGFNHRHHMNLMGLIIYCSLTAKEHFYSSRWDQVWKVNNNLSGADCGSLFCYLSSIIFSY